MTDSSAIMQQLFFVKKTYALLWTNIMEHYNLTRAEVEVLAYLAAFPERNTARDIAEFRAIAKSHISKAVDSLIDRGYLRREPDEADRRCIHLKLTEEVGTIVTSVRKRQREFAELLTAGFTEDELQFFSKMIARIAENAAEIR